MRISPTADATRLARLHARAFETPWSAEAIHSLFAAGGVFALLAQGIDGRDGGLVLMRIAAAEAEVLTLAVDPARRRQGFARALLEAAHEAASGLGAETVFLEVAVDNDPAVRLYLAQGFTQVGRRPRYYGRATGSVDALVLRRNLNRPPTSLYDVENR